MEPIPASTTNAPSEYFNGHQPVLQAGKSHVSYSYKQTASTTSGHHAGTAAGSTEPTTKSPDWCTADTRGDWRNKNALIYIK